jgi:hypothetical protein
MVVIDDAGCLNPRGVLQTIASVLAPTVFVSFANPVYAEDACRSRLAGDGAGTSSILVA